MMQMLIFTRLFTKRLALVHTLVFTLVLTFLTAQNAALAAPQKTILVVGDSISAAYGIDSKLGWVALLAERVNATAPHYSVKNASISGDTTAGGAQRMPALLKAHTPALVVIELGGNDALRGLPMSQTEANFTAMIRAAKTAKAQVLLVSMQIPPNYGAAYGKSFNALYAKLGKAHAVKTSDFIFKSFAEDLTYFQRDRIHPTLAAQSMMLDAVWPALKPLLK
jgi:acyl-CoA thioesterase I